MASKEDILEVILFISISLCQASAISPVGNRASRNLRPKLAGMWSPGIGPFATEVTTVKLHFSGNMAPSFIAQRARLLPDRRRNGRNPKTRPKSRLDQRIGLSGPAHLRHCNWSTLAQDYPIWVCPAASPAENAKPEWS